MSVLLIEDDDDTRSNMVDILTLDDLTVIAVSSIQDARTAMKSSEVEIAILDRKLPDGFAEDLIPEFREQRPPIDVIVATGYGDLNSTISALRQGAADYLLKPINPDALRDSVSRILDRRRIARELHNEHQLANQILTTAEAVVLVLDLKGRVVRFNPYFSRVFGWTLEDVTGEDWFTTCLPENDREWVRDIFNQTLAGVRTDGVSHPILTRDGSERQIRWSNTTLQDEAGTVTAILSIGVDETDVFEARKRALQQERLATIGQTMAALAHESRNALQRISAGVELLDMDAEPETTSRRTLDSIRRATSDLRTLLDEVRSFAAPIVLNQTHCKLPKIWSHAWESLQQLRHGRDVSLSVEQAEADPVVFGDASRLEQVFRNLFENSLGACHDPVEIRLQCRAAAEERVQILVSDNGPGFTADAFDGAFEAFFTTKPTGTGLGLSIVERIIDAHHGSIRILQDSKPGAHFLIELPVKVTDSP